jgi:DNA-binding MarR family transcriptional regulator
MMENLVAGNENQQYVAEIDRLIHEPSRYHIMAILYVVHSADFLFLMNHTGLTGGNLSTHLRKLESSGYISTKKEFLNNKPHTTISVTKKGRLAFDQYRKNMKQALDTLPRVKSIEP